MAWRGRGVAWTGSDAKGRSFLVSESPRQACVEANEIEEKRDLEDRFSFGGLKTAGG